MNQDFQLDHVVLLLPYKDIVSPPSWITDNFNVSPGGRHGDGRTENKLVIFADGTYLELIAFVDDDASKRNGHWWDKPYGIVDFALTSASQASLVVEDLNARIRSVGSEVRYQQPVIGGRIRPDGVEMQWAVTFPVMENGLERGMVPFFCHDITARDLRVPISPETTTHPCGAKGMAGVRIDVSHYDLMANLERAMSGIIASSDPSRKQKHSIARPINIDTQRPWIHHSEDRHPSQRPFELSLTLHVASDAHKKTIEREVAGGLVLLEFN